MQPTNVNQSIIRFYDAVTDFDHEFDDTRCLLGEMEMCLDVRSKCDIGSVTPVYAPSGRTLLKIKAQDGSRVFLRNAKLEFLDDHTVQITFRRDEQMASSPPRSLTAAQVAESKAICESMCNQDDADPCDEDEPVFILWESGSIEQCENEDEAKTLLMEMGSRGCSGQIFQSQEDASEALKAHALAYNKKHAT